MRFVLPLISLSVPALLAGCLNTPAQPTDVDVSAARIEVTMSNRQTCVGDAPVAGESWQGVLQGCDSPYPYRVTFDGRQNPIRSGLEDVFNAIGVDLAPLATIEIDGPAGNTWTFASPEPSEFDE